MVREALGVAPDGYREDDVLESQDLDLEVAEPDLDLLYTRPAREDGRVPAVASRAPGGPPIALAGMELRGFTVRLLPKKSYGSGPPRGSLSCSARRA